MREGLLCHVCTSFFAGLTSTLASSPFDVVKSRVMSQPRRPDGSGQLYAGMVDCLVKTARAEGVLALYNGFWPNFGRIVPRVTVIFIIMEQLKLNFG